MLNIHGVKPEPRTILRITMKKLLLAVSLVLAGCSTYPVTRIAIVHDYILQGAVNACRGYSGLHYIVSVDTIYAESSIGVGHDKDYPCRSAYRVRCQDGTLLTLKDDGGRYCFISEMQLEETMKDVIVKVPLEYP
jgi:hypothetical protein